jgi:hypothetical protein
MHIARLGSSDLQQAGERNALGDPVLHRFLAFSAVFLQQLRPPGVPYLLQKSPFPAKSAEVLRQLRVSLRHGLIAATVGRMGIILLGFRPII